jgi:hypothetical protein
MIFRDSGAGGAVSSPAIAELKPTAVKTTALSHAHPCDMVPLLLKGERQEARPDWNAVPSTFIRPRAWPAKGGRCTAKQRNSTRAVLEFKLQPAPNNLNIELQRMLVSS